MLIGDIFCIILEFIISPNMESQSRSSKLDDLSKDTPNVPRSFLDRFSDKLLAIITPKEVTDLYEVQRVGSGLNSGVPASAPLDLTQVLKLIDQAANELRLATPETYGTTEKILEDSPP